MPDICDLILDDHEQFRRRFAELDEKRANGATPDEVIAHWDPLAHLLERHASAEEQIFYPHLLKHGARAEDETQDAICDHNDIRDAVRRAAAARPGSREWWDAVLDAREENNKHIGEEERESLPDFRVHAEQRLRDELGTAWLRFSEDHAGARDLRGENKDPGAYIDRNT